MSYSVETISRAAQSTSVWSGGTTTQLAIYPKASDYKERNFKWRLSSALVEAEESTFTSLPGIHRHIMIIEGEMTLIHEGHREVLLRPFLQDSFSGGWNTRSIGRARDFNLMLGQDSKGELEAVFVKGDAYVDGTAVIPDKDLTYTTQGFYCAAGSAGMLVNGTEKYDLNEGELVMLHYPKWEEKVNITFRAPENVETVIIRAGISYT